MKLENIQTPALVLDQARMTSNAERMMSRMKQLGVNLRPHLKTCKSIDVASCITTKNFAGITVSTVAEAEYFCNNGVTDITLAACIVPSRLERIATLNRNGAEVKVITDSVNVAEAIAQHSGPHHVLIEIDCGEHRTGLEPGDPRIVEIARLISNSSNAQFAGVLTHAGHSYLCRSVEAMIQIAEAERSAVVGVAKMLSQQDIECPIVSVGSTPTATFANNLNGVTEARPGVFIFYDLFQAGIGTCKIEDIAMSVLATVISHRPEHNEMMIDAGGLALSKDRSTAALENDCGYGLVCDVATGEPVSGLKVKGDHQEHGEITSDKPINFDQFPVGSQVRLLPNHACMTAAAYNEYHVIDSSADDPTAVVANWGRCNGW